MSKYNLDRVTIVMMSAVGDAVHVLPVINAIKRHHPPSKITWVLQPVPASLVRGHPSVDDIVVFDRNGGVGEFLRVRRELSRTPADVLIDLQVYLKAGIITALSGAPVRLGFDRPRARDLNWLFTNRKIPARPMQHVQDQYFEFLSELGVNPEPVVWNIGPWPSEREWQREFVASVGDRYAAIVVSTSRPDKDWIPERWASVCDILKNQYGLRSVLVGGNSAREAEAAERIMRDSSSSPLNALGSGLRKLISIIDKAEVVLTPDTGPLHIAVALDRPVISLIGYTDPRRTGPYRKFHDLIIDAYRDPGEDLPISMQTRSGRMGRITVDDVSDRLRLWSERYSPKA